MIILNFYPGLKPWEERRKSDPNFIIPNTKEGYEKLVEKKRPRYEKLLKYLKNVDFFSEPVTDIGVGGGELEYILLKNQIAKNIVLTDYRKDFLDEFKDYFNEFTAASFEEINLPFDSEKIKTRRIFFHRADNEFTSEKFEELISKLFEEPERELMFACTSVITPYLILRNIKYIILNFWRQDLIYKSTSGYSRSVSEYKKIAKKLKLNLKISFLKGSTSESNYNIYILKNS